jgi:hypothetical protein
MSDQFFEGSASPNLARLKKEPAEEPLWRSLLEAYAIRARQLADDVASLHEHGLQASAQVSPGFLKKWKQVERRDAACGEARGQICRYLKRAV